MSECHSLVEKLSVCFVIPTYNNHRTLKRIIEGTQKFSGHHLIVVDDGSTDTTPTILKSLNLPIIITHEQNLGKAAALKNGFSRARSLGYHYVITLDSDGQHLPDDIPKLLESIDEHGEALIVGSRNMDQSGIPAKRSFGNKFARFWFWVQTGLKIPDTQSGFRAYPMSKIIGVKMRTNRFELETELLVKLAWMNVPIVPVPIQTIYDTEHPVSHFKPSVDFTRISILNTYYVILTILYYLPKRLFFKDGFINTIKRELKKDESSAVKAASIGFGLLMSVTPLWGFQSIVGLPVAIVFRLNKVLFLLFVNTSIPPLIPLIVYLSFLMGTPFASKNQVSASNISDFSMETIQTNLVQYTYGSLILAILWGVVGFAVAYPIIKALKKSNGDV